MNRKVIWVSIACLAIGVALGANLQADRELEAPFSYDPEITGIEPDFNSPFWKSVTDEVAIRMLIDSNGQLHATLYVRMFGVGDNWRPVPVDGFNELGLAVVPLANR